ncbi:glycoside hydrolase family 3 C-terminal domain-containing protein [Luteimicrobium sp. DT211]|uniref:glycoside hydrolase family 3 C-terminal domain-containing protein n=1 Tax=Luteimicrobium sp. DT211 TaxID=3393412 RepID=UPI003CF07942
MADGAPVSETALDVPPYRDPALPAPERAADLARRLTRDEKIAMLHQTAPAVERLGLAAFRTGTEALHGVAWLGTATLFPQPVGLAATWDADVVTRVGEVVGVELRAKHADDPTISLNAWAPVVNPLRHPLWGRNEEGFSEDPHVTAWLATAYARGLRGDHPVYWRTVPTLKHAFGYSNETDRAVTSSELRPRVWHEYEAPAFLGPVRAGVVGGVMASYNLVNGRPAHLSRELLDALRDAAPHDLLVVSDAAAPGFVVDLQRYADDHVESHAALLRAGIDSFTELADPTETVERLTAALELGLVGEEDVDRAVRHLLEVRIRTGELDPELDPFVEPADAIDLPRHRALAREAATKAVVVLENDGALPLPAGARVAVTGPLAGVVLRDWYSGPAPYTVSVATALAEQLGSGAVHVADGADRVALRSATTGRCVRPVTGRAVLVADAVDSARALHDVTGWDDGFLTLRSVGEEGSGALWTGADWIVRASAERVGGWVAQEAFRRHVHDDGTWSFQHHLTGRWVRVQHDEQGTLVVDADVLEQAERFTPHALRTGRDDVARVARDAGTAVVVLGNDPHLGGREATDRGSLELPASMLALWRAVREAAATAVLVIVSSYPYVLPDDLDADAVVWSSHGGQELGHALADVLLGEHEPRGRLAQSWPAATEHVGDLLDYDVLRAGHTTWYSPHAPRYGLGHGLTYGDVRYDDVRLDRASAAAGDVVRASVSVRSAGTRDAHELVQLYVDAPDLGLPYPHRLVAHRRVVVPAGATASVELELAVDDLAVWDTVGHRRAVAPGTYTLAAGPSSALVGPAATLEVEGARFWPRPCLDRDVDPVDADELDGLALSDRTAEEGTCVQVAPGRTEGRALLRECDLAGTVGLTLTVARARPGPAQVRVDACTPTGWRTLGSVAVPEPDDDADDLRHAWSRVRVDVPSGWAPVLPGDVRLVLTGGARCAGLRFHGEASNTFDDPASPTFDSRRPDRPSGLTSRDSDPHYQR